MTRADILRSSVRAAIKNGCPRSSISVPAWAATYGVTQKLVREVWSEELTKIPPSFDAPTGEGK